MEITTVREKKRGCGFRHSGSDGLGIYLMGAGVFENCERLPFPLECCPTCGAGIKFSRGFSWILPAQMLDHGANPRCCPEVMFHSHDTCFACSPPEGKHGLLWVGEKFYTPEEFAREALSMGVSKRIAAIPNGFEFGKHIVYLAHKKAIKNDAGEFGAGVFMVFKPSRVDLVVDTTDPDQLPDRAKHLAEKLGDRARLVKVEPEEDQPDMFPDAGDQPQVEGGEYVN